MTVFGTVAVSAFSLGVGLVFALLTYNIWFGLPPKCPIQLFKGLGGSLQCGDGNPSFTPYGLAGVVLAAAVGVRWWRRFLRSLDA